MKVTTSSFLFILTSFFLQGQIEFYDATTSVLGDEEVFSTICIGFEDLDGDQRDDLFLLDQGKILKTFIAGEPNQTFDYKEHLQISVNSDWSFLSGDLDNDGIPEIISNSSQLGSQFFKWDGDTYFKYFGTDAVFFQNSNLVDFNNDGFVDFFVCNDDGESLTYLNNGSGGMIETKLIDFQTSPSDDMSGNYSSIFTDIDGDSDLDLYIGKCKAGVTDPTDPRRVNTLYINNGDGTYTEMANEFGLDIGAQTWSVDSGDIDNDGDTDILIANHDRPHDLMINDGNGHFDRKTLVPGGYTSFAYQSFLCDFDNNGWLDIIVTDPSRTYILFNDEMSFTRRDFILGVQKAFSTATGDLNSDGFPDLYFSFANSFQQPNSEIADKVYLNETNDYNYLDINLIGTQSNRDAIGARVTIYHENSFQTREVIVGRSYGIMNSRILHFGLGNMSVVDSIHVEWPSGIETLMDDVSTINTLLTITEEGCITNTMALPNLQLCNNDSIKVNLPIGYDSYSWSNGGNQNEIWISEAGWYRAELVKDDCSTFTSYFEVVEEVDLDKSEVLPEIDQVICEGDIIKLTAYPGIAYEWSNGDDTQSIEIEEPGTYSLSLTTNCSEYISDQVRVAVVETNTPIVENDTIMVGDQAFFTGESDDLNWYQDKNDLEPITTGREFETPELLESETYFVGSISSGWGLNKILMSNVPLNSVSDSSFTENDTIEFTVFQDLTLNSVSVRTQKEGEREFVILQGANRLTSLNVELDAGVNEVVLNYHFEPGQYSITTDPLSNISNLGTSHPQLSYSEIYTPKDKMINGHIEVSDSKLYPGFSSYFFGWNIDYGFYECEPRVPVQAVVKTSVSTKDVNLNSIVFPNPTNGKINIVTEMDLPFEFQLFDVSGSKISNAIKSYVPEITIEMPYNNGMYFLKLTNETGSTVKKIYVY